MRTRFSRASKQMAAVAMAAAALTTATPASAAEAEAEAPQRTVVTTFATGAVGDTFECGGVIGRLWCK